MYSAIKEIVDRSVQANLNMGFRIAMVKSQSELQLDQGLTLPIAPCVVLENVGGVKLTVGDSSYALREKVAVGDRLLLLHIGNDYCILGRLGNLFDEKML